MKQTYYILYFKLNEIDVGQDMKHTYYILYFKLNEIDVGRGMKQIYCILYFKHIYAIELEIKNTIGLQNIHIKLKIETRTPLKPGGELRCSGKLSSSCSTNDICRVNLVMFIP